MKVETTSFFQEKCSEHHLGWIEIGVYFFEKRIRIILFSTLIFVMCVLLMWSMTSFKEIKMIIKLGQVDSGNAVISSQLLEQTILNKFVDEVDHDLGYSIKFDIDYLGSSEMILRIKTPVNFFNRMETNKIIDFQKKLLLKIMKDQEERISLIEKKMLVTGDVEKVNSKVVNVSKPEIILSPKISKTSFGIIKGLLAVVALFFVSVISSLLMILSQDFYSQVKDRYLKLKILES